MVILNNNSNKYNEKKRYKTGALTLLEIRKYQKNKHLLFKKIPFYKLVKSITNKHSDIIFKWSSNAIFLLQEVFRIKQGFRKFFNPFFNGL